MAFVADVLDPSKKQNALAAKKKQQDQINFEASRGRMFSAPQNGSITGGGDAAPIGIAGVKTVLGG